MTKSFFTGKSNCQNYLFFLIGKNKSNYCYFVADCQISPLSVCRGKEVYNYAVVQHQNSTG